MITELVAVGTEILLGNIVNTNSAYLAEKCAQLGLSLYYQTVVGDNEQRMKDTIKTALDRSDVVILTGGLGPTEDDLTKEITAEVMGLPLVEDAHSRELLDAYLKQYEKMMPSAGSLPIIINRQWFLRGRLFWITIMELLRVLLLKRTEKQQSFFRDLQTN